jgi:iron complex outermembrane recepter protein
MPAHLSSFWATRNFRIKDTFGFTPGLGVRYTGASWDGSDVLKTPSFTLVDALLAFDHRAWRFAVNAANLADKVYAATCIARGDCFYGVRRTVTATISYKF